MTTAAPAVSSQTVSDDFARAMADKLDNDLIDAAVATLNAADMGGYAAAGGVASGIFYLRFHLSISRAGGKTFDGNAGGIAAPGAGALIGTVYTNDIDALYATP